MFILEIQKKNRGEQRKEIKSKGIGDYIPSLFLCVWLPFFSFHVRRFV
jgi:hypothetical protein